jgi:hypothetical protein
MAGTMSTGLTFTASTHRYRLDSNPVPGVTTILGVLEKPAIPKWAAGMVAEFVADNPDGVAHLRSMGRGPMIAALKEVPWQFLADAAERGTSFHTYAEQIMQGQEADVPDSLVPLVESALDFADKWCIKPVLIEAAVGSREHRFAGTLDLIADHNHGPRAIFDWKSGRKIYTECVFQLNAYGHAEFHGLNGDEHPMVDLGIEAAYGVHIRADGYDVYPLRYGPDIFDEFLCIRRAFDIKKRAYGNWKKPGSGYVGAAIQDGPDTEQDVA